MSRKFPIRNVQARAYTIPTDSPEADGTISWDKTTLIVATLEAGDQTGIGYTYAAATNAALIRSTLAHVIEGEDAFDIPRCVQKLEGAVRNLGRQGLAATAISALDAALWDVKAKLLGLPLASLLGMVRDEVLIYGSGGFTTYTDAQLQEQLGGWVVQNGCRWVKMKIGSEPERDPDRIAAARAAIGDAGLFVDANGAFQRKQALHFADWMADRGVAWFEEPISSDDLEGLQLLRARAPAVMEIAAGEYAYETDYIRRMLEAGAVDVQQADASRCGGISGFMAAGVLCAAHHTQLSGHCAPSLHLHAACAVRSFRHLEWFHDHVRIEHMLFDGSPRAEGGVIKPDLSRPGLGLDFRWQDAEKFSA